MIQSRIGRAAEDPPGDGIRSRDADRILEGIEVNVQVGGECAPGDADPLAVQRHLSAVAFAEEICHQLDHRIGGECLALFNTLVGLQLEAGQRGHDKEIAVEIAHGLLEQGDLEAPAGV